MIIIVEELLIVVFFLCIRFFLWGVVVLLFFLFFLDKIEDLICLFEDREWFVIFKGDIILFIVGVLMDLKFRFEEWKLFVFCVDFIGCLLLL